MTEVEFEKVCSIATSLEEIARQLKEANRLLGGVCSVADKSLAHPAIDPDKKVPRKEPEDNTSTCGDSFTDDRPYWFR